MAKKDPHAGESISTAQGRNLANGPTSWGQAVAMANSAASAQATHNARAQQGFLDSLKGGKQTKQQTRRDIKGGAASGFQQLLDAAGNPLFDDSGNPVFDDGSGYGEDGGGEAAWDPTELLARIQGQYNVGKEAINIAGLNAAVQFALMKQQQAEQYKQLAAGVDARQPTLQATLGAGGSALDMARLNEGQAAQQNYLASLNQNQQWQLGDRNLASNTVSLGAMGKLENEKFALDADALAGGGGSGGGGGGGRGGGGRGGSGSDPQVTAGDAANLAYEEGAGLTDYRGQIAGSGYGGKQLSHAAARFANHLDPDLMNVGQVSSRMIEKAKARKNAGKPTYSIKKFKAQVVKPALKYQQTRAAQRTKQSLAGGTNFYRGGGQ